MPAEKVSLSEEESTRLWYDDLGLAVGASEDAIKAAYKKLALKYHPDKNRGGGGADGEAKAAAAAKMFMKVSEASTFLLEEREKRKLYDEKLLQKVKAARQAEERFKGMNAQRRTFREQFQAREKAAEEAKQAGGRGTAAGPGSEEAKRAARQADIDRLKRESRGLKEQHAMAQQRKESDMDTVRDAAKKRKLQDDSVAAREALDERQIRLKWSRKKLLKSTGGGSSGGVSSHSEDSLARLFGRFGTVESVSLLSEGNKALLTFVSPSVVAAAVHAYSRGDEMRATLVGARKKRAKLEEDEEQARAAAAAAGQVPEPRRFSLRDLEDLETMKVRREEERRRLIQEMEAGEGGGVSEGKPKSGERDTSGGEGKEPPQHQHQPKQQHQQQQKQQEPPPPPTTQEQASPAPAAATESAPAAAVSSNAAFVPEESEADILAKMMAF